MLLRFRLFKLKSTLFFREWGGRGGFFVEMGIYSEIYSNGVELV